MSARRARYKWRMIMTMYTSWYSKTARDIVRVSPAPTGSCINAPIARRVMTFIALVLCAFKHALYVALLTLFSDCYNV